MAAHRGVFLGRRIPFLSSTDSGTASLPMSCSSPASCIITHSSSEKPIRSASAQAIAATPAELRGGITAAEIDQHAEHPAQGPELSHRKTQIADQRAGKDPEATPSRASSQKLPV
jgi:hypothetical protein